MFVNLRRPAFLAAGLVLASLGAGCAPEIQNHGHVISQEDLGRIVPGVTSQEEVLRTLGSPSSIATFDPTNWYYVSQRTERMSFYQSWITNQDVVTLVFNQDGIVDGIETLDMSRANNIDPDPDTTRTLGNELSIVEQFVGNIGRFSTQEGGPQP